MDFHHARSVTQHHGQDMGLPFFDLAPSSTNVPSIYAPEAQSLAQSSSTIPDISEERFEKNITTIKLLQERMEEDETKWEAKSRVSPPKEATHTESGEKILSLEPSPILVVKKMPVREDLDDSPLIVIRQISTEEDPIPPPSTSHVPIIESYTPWSREQLQEDASHDDFTHSTTSTSSTMLTLPLSDPPKPIEIQVALPQQSSPFLSDSQFS